LESAVTEADNFWKWLECFWHGHTHRVQTKRDSVHNIIAPEAANFPADGEISQNLHKYYDYEWIAIYKGKPRMTGQPPERLQFSGFGRTGE
jgi:hypothetical protein